MGAPRLQVVAATPGAASVAEIVRLKLKQGNVLVSAFSPERLRAAKETLGESEKIDYVEFGALVGQFLMLAGGSAAGLPSSGHTEAALSLACETLLADSAFGRTSQTPGFQKRLVGCLSDLRSYGLESEGLAKLAETAPPELAGRLLGLSEVQEEAANTLALLGKRFNSERIRQCLELDPQTAFQPRIVLLAGCEDSPVDLSWIPWAVAGGAEMTVVVDAHPANGEMFKGGQRIAERLGVPVSPLARSNVLTSRLFVEGDPQAGPTPLEVEVWAMPDALGECEWTLRAALEAIEKGIPATRLAIMTRRIDEYAPLLEACALRLGVSLSVSRRMPLLSTGVPKFLLELIEALSEREPTRLAISARSSYMGLTPIAVQALQEAVRAARREVSDPWSALEQFARGAAEFEWLARLLDWRRECLREPTTLAGWAERFRALGELPWLAQIFEGNEPTSVRDRYAMNVLQRSLADMAAIERVKDSGSLALRSFARRCRIRWEREEVAIPRTPSGVAVVGSAEGLGDIDTLFVLGMLEGVFPRRRSEDPILADDDLKWISEQIGEALPDSHRRAKEERDEFFRVCASPSHRLVLSYPQTGEDRDNVRAFYLSEVERLIGIGRPEVRSRRQWTPDQPIAEADVRLRDAMLVANDEPLPLRLELESTKQIARRQPGESYRLEDLARVLDCPFHHLAASRLKLRTNRPQSRWNRLLALPKAVGLPSLSDPETATRLLLDRLDEMVDDAIGEATDDDLTLMRLGGRRLVTEWVEREFAARKLWNREAAYPEASFDGIVLRNRFKTRDGESLDLTGSFPGISQIGDHKVIHLFMGHDPVAEPRTETLEDKLRESDRFVLGMAIASIRDAKQGAGLEIDVADGQRRLFMTPRPAPPPPVTSGFSVTTVDEDERREWIDFVEERCRVALARLAKPEVDARPGPQCTFCDMGELCRRSHDFSELGDPFASEEEGA